MWISVETKARAAACKGRKQRVVDWGDRAARYRSHRRGEVLTLKPMDLLC